MEERTVGVNYFEDLRGGKKHSQLYSILRKNGFHPREAISYYDPSKGVGVSHFKFREEAEIPDRKRLEELFKGITLLGYSVF